ncbi:GAF domain-containing protein [Glaciihabitans arcticus]|uniref:GAF domain-containing protein n=1 Tax=Glaciihabitans arcticus TaxID=2668039 RepID=A0A4Q9H0H4_9MICO|nr:GAF domain-containing protein [Glaciihabitans arcticus]TBN58190.1 GAF domain-containing protein [Glaciihabitans arcticus]
MLREIVMALIRPFMRVWVAGVEDELDSVPRPRDRPQVHAPGVDSDRLLLVGSGPAAGWGVLSHELSLPGALARSLSQVTGRGAVVDVLVDPDMTAVSALRQLGGSKLWRYDAVILIIGVNDAIAVSSPRGWRRAMGALLRYAESASSKSTQVFVVEIPPIRALRVFDALPGRLAERHARALNRITASIVQGLDRTTVVPFEPISIPTPNRYRSPEEYRAWAELLVPTIATSLGDPRNHLVEPPGAHKEHEEERQLAVDALGIVDTDPEERFDRIVALARRAFGTQAAAFTVTDHHRHWIKSGVGTEVPEFLRAESVCDTTIKAVGAVVVGDLSLDARFRDFPMVIDSSIRFYAGFPVESPTGERIGALCVFDPEPRTGGVDEVLLRELAMLVQAELWHPTKD